MKLGLKVLEVYEVKCPRDEGRSSSHLDPTHRFQMGPLVLFGASVRRINEPSVDIQNRRKIGIRDTKVLFQ